MSKLSTRVALFVIDIQNDLATDPATRIPHASRVRDAAGQVLVATRSQLDSARQSRQASQDQRPLIVFVQHSEDPSSGPLVRGTEPWELVFPPRGGDADEIVVGKTTGKRFFYFYSILCCLDE
jgi:nicotinamidase-related amidase